MNLHVDPQEQIIDNLTVWIPFRFYSALRMSPHLKTKITVSQITDYSWTCKHLWGKITNKYNLSLFWDYLQTKRQCLWTPLTAPRVLTVLHLCSSVYFHSYSCYIQIRNSFEVNLHITVTMHVIYDYCSRQGTTFVVRFILHISYEIPPCVIILS